MTVSANIAHKTARGLAICILVVGAPYSSTQASPPAADGSRSYASCVVCHQPNADGSTDGNIPSLAGQQRRYLEKQIAGFRAGAREDTAMQIVAVHPTFSDPRNLATVAGYLSALPANPNPVTGSGKHLQEGEELYTHVCAACHGNDGLGQSGNRIPRLAGQHYPYLRRRIGTPTDFHMDLAPPEMSSALRGMRAADKDALADYISRIGSFPTLPIQRRQQ